MIVTCFISYPILAFICFLWMTIHTHYEGEDLRLNDLFGIFILAAIWPITVCVYLHKVGFFSHVIIKGRRK
jgi:hypothetical protein